MTWHDRHFYRVNKGKILSFCKWPTKPKTPKGNRKSMSPFWDNARPLTSRLLSARHCHIHCNLASHLIIESCISLFSPVQTLDTQVLQVVCGHYAEFKEQCVHVLCKKKKACPHQLDCIFELLFKLLLKLSLS